MNAPGRDDAFEQAVERYARARATVLERIADACARAGREPSGVTLVAVSKTVAAESLQAAVAAGLTVLGENRVQEGETKAPLLPGVTWHLVGPLQSNKARRAVETFDVIQSVESGELARRLDRLVREVRGFSADGAVADGARLPVLLQVNVDEDPAKAGVQPAAAGAVVEEIAACGGLRLDGLMTIGRLARDSADARATFAGLRELSERLRAAGAPVGPALSMGMSDDYALAVEEGATIVRVGRALFGERAPIA